MVNCYAETDPVFSNPMRLIEAITQSFPVTITTSFDHGYSTGLIVRLFIPPKIGMQEANGFYGPIAVTGDDTFTMDLDTTNFVPYDVPDVWYIRGCGQVIPIGEVNETLYLANVNIL